MDIRERQVTSALARIQVELVVPVTNQYHQLISIDEEPARLLAHLDGKHDRKALSGVMIGLAEECDIEVSQDGAAGGGSGNPPVSVVRCPWICS
jgi:methyltransferase-like protein